MEKFIPNKKQAQQIHAKRRAAERYGVTINKDARRDIVNRIKEQMNIQKETSFAPTTMVPPDSPTYVGKQSNRVSEWQVPLQGKNLRVLYDSKRSTLITCLPPKDEEEPSDGNDPSSSV